jgi:DNA modification methylase
MKVPVDQLKNHPLNKEIYDLSSIDELVESIKKVGLLQPLTVDQYNQVISGNRRFEAIRRIGWKKVDINRITIVNGDEVLYLIHFNKQRVKKVKELLAEYDHLSEYYKHIKSVKGEIPSIREKVGEEIKVSDGQLARILFVRKHNPELIDLIDKGIMTVNQSYLQSQRNQKEITAININGKPSGHIDKKKDFRFFQKSSKNMTELLDNEVQTIFTSPPYFNKRLYSKEGGLGNEKTSNEFVESLVDHLSDCYRVLNKRGSFFLVMGDTFVNSNLENVPHKVVIKLQERGWILRNTIIWSKTNPKPSSSKSNLTPSYEFIFHLVKTSEYDYCPTLTALSDKTKPSLPPRHRSLKDGSVKSVSPYIPDSRGKNIGDYWSEDIVRTAVVNQSTYTGLEHPAMFPEQIVYLPILQTCVYPFMNSAQNNTVVLDLFCGNLSTYKVIKRINENFGVNLKFVGYDIKKYF